MKVTIRLEESARDMLDRLLLSKEGQGEVFVSEIEFNTATVKAAGTTSDLLLETNHLRFILESK